MAERSPEPRGLDEQLESWALLELLVCTGREVPSHGFGHVCVDVERRRARRPIAGAFLSADRAPRKCYALNSQLPGSRSREVDRGVAPAESVARSVRQDVGQNRQRVAFHVPEGVTVVAV